MKILVTGKNGYIARSFAEFNKHNKYNKYGKYMDCTLISLRGDAWQDISFAGYDAVLHTAGIVHKRETRSNQYDYYIINRDLTEAVAKKAKADGVRQFVFLSSISVYGKNSGIITTVTPTAPKTHYGRSKLAAESLLLPLADDVFKVAILRPPMVYGPGSPGNYSRLCRLVQITPVFPDYPNARSIVEIENLCAFINDIIENNRSGLFFPKDPAPVSTTEMAAAIAADIGKNLRTTRTFNGLISLLMPLKVMSKLFGSLTIED